jgi:flavin-binding protein dodecin
MAIHKVIDVLSQSDKSWRMPQSAIKDAAKTVKKIKSIYIENMEGVVKDNKIVQYCVNANITFELED